MKTAFKYAILLLTALEISLGLMIVVTQIEKAEIRDMNSLIEEQRELISQTKINENTINDVE